ncbi:MAG: transglycosylase SLT domain-containing protein [Armatimonadia bacterium]|nr:transglycosylase SLT domain-containing protein [Armatimonadia bacterium]
MPGGSSSYYGTDQLTGLPYYGAPRPQQPAYTGHGWSHGSAATPSGAALQGDQVAQYAAYCNLARYFNPSLTTGEAQAVASALFEACARYGVPRPLMASLIYAESSYRPLCKSHAGAMGLCQLMPGTASGLGVTSPYEIRQNVHGGTKYLADMLRRYQDRGWSVQLQLALAAYNAGPGAVDRAGGIPQNSETPPYVNKVVRTYSLLWQKGYR